MKGVPIYSVELKRFLTEREAATYAGMTLIEFRRDCQVAPRIRSQGRKVWDVQDLDQWLDVSVNPQSDRVQDAINRL